MPIHQMNCNETGYLPLKGNSVFEILFTRKFKLVNRQYL